MAHWGADTTTLLYYPAFRPPSNSWIRQALMYWDRFATIVPEEHQREVMTPDLDYLANEGVYRAKNPGEVLNSRASGEDLARTLREKLDSPEIRKVLDERTGEGTYSIAIGKLNEQVREVLDERRLIPEGSQTGPVPVRRSAALVYLALLARHIGHAQMSYMPYDVCTDNPEVESMAFRDGNSVGLQFLLREVLPVPCDDVPFEDILKLRARRSHELKRFRLHIDSLEDELDRLSDPREIEAKKRHIQSQLDVELGDISRLIADARMKTRLVSFQALYRVGGPLLTGALAGAHSGIPTGSLLGAAVGLAVGGALEISQVRVTAQEQLSPAYRSKLGYLFAASEEGLT